MQAIHPWPLVAAGAAVLALWLMLGLKLISPKRFAQLLAGLGAGCAVGLALTSGGGHG